jgi:acetolactate decarboxylase
MNIKVFSILFLVLCCGCTSSHWNGKVERWGTLREVLRDGNIQGRMNLSDVTDHSGAIGIGALNDLSGEITIVEGEVWISRPKGTKETITKNGAATDDKAAFLVLTNVINWQEFKTNKDMDMKGLQEFLVEKTAEVGLSKTKTIPFIVKGSFHELSAHVLRGGCPFAANEALRKDPVRVTRPHAQGRLVGFITSLPPGTLTHHGSRLHVHVVLDDPEPFAGHLDKVLIPQSSSILIPVAR